MIAPFIEIPPGLEDAYHKIVAYLGGNNPDTIIVKQGSPARKNFSRVSNRSLFVLWKSLWRGFDSSRKNAWTAYWLTLPFGDHGGENGWPGSGYSAFVYVNAPRYAEGLDLLLDPPTAVELIYNGGFVGSADGWDLFDDAYYFDNAIHFDIENQYADFLTKYEHLFSLTAFATYRLSCDYVGTIETAWLYLYNRESADLMIELALPAGSGHYSAEAMVPEDFDDRPYWGAYFLSEDFNEGYITNVSVQRIS